MSNTTKGLTLKHKIGYGAGDCGGVVTLVMMGYMTRYLTNILKVDMKILASILLVWNIWDAVNDPMMGTLMDMVFAKQKGAKKDKFRPWILASIPVMVVGLVAFFTVPAKLGGGFPMLISVFLLKIVFEGGYTMMNIAMGSLLGVMSTNDNERAGLSSARGFGSTIGGMLGQMIIPIVISKLGETPAGYAVASVVAAALGAFIIFIHYSWTEERNAAAQVAKADSEEDKVKVTDILEVFKKNRAYLALCLHSIAICFAQGIQSNSAVYMYADVLGDMSLQAVASPISTGLLIVILSIAPKLAKKMDLVNIIRYSLVGGIASFVALYAVMMTAGLPNIVFVLWNAISSAMVILSVQMQWGLVGESIDYNEYLTGKRTEGSIYGTFSLTRRVGTTIAASLAVLMLEWIGYNPELATQTATTVKGLMTMNLLAPAIGAVFSFLSFTFVWNINKDVRVKMAAWKAEKEK